MIQRIPSLDQIINEQQMILESDGSKNIGEKISFQGATVAVIKDFGTVKELIVKYEKKIPAEALLYAKTINQNDNAYAVVYDDKMIGIHTLADIESKPHQRIIE